MGILDAPGISRTQADIRYSYNNAVQVNAGALKRWRLAHAKALSGQANARVLCLGDSTTFGTGSNNQSGFAGGDMIPLSYPTQLVAMLNAAGITANSHGFFGDGSTLSSNESRHANDSRVQVGSDWTPTTNSIGGAFYLSGANTAHPLSFTPTSPVDTFIVWYIQNTSNGVLSGNINGGAATTKSTAGSLSLQTMTVTGALGTNTLNLSWSSGGQVGVVGIEAFDSTKKQVNVMVAGWPGVTAVTASAQDAGYAPLTAAKRVAADLYVVCLGINDWRTGITVSAYTTALTSIVSTLNTAGDVVVVSPAPSRLTYASQDLQAQFVSAMQSIALGANVPFIDNWSRFGPQASNLGMYGPLGGAGDLHPNMVGYADFARPIMNAMIQT
jgi:lysophospholipase L1-like esterase